MPDELLHGLGAEVSKSNSTWQDQRRPIVVRPAMFHSQ